MAYLYLAAMLVSGIVMDNALVPHMTIDDVALFICALIALTSFALLTLRAASRH